MQIDERTNLIELFDTYGELLSEKQFYVTKKILELDLSESELAEVFGETRQSVHDAALKAKRQLMEFEEKCRLVEIKRNLRETLLKIADNLEKGEIDEVKVIVERILEKL